MLIVFTFLGTSISVYGALFPAGTFNRVSKYTIDGKNSTVYNPPGTISSEQHRVQFYDSGTLPFGQHTLTIENLGEEYWFDFIKADGVDPTLGGPNGSYSYFQGFKGVSHRISDSDGDVAGRVWIADRIRIADRPSAALYSRLPVYKCTVHSRFFRQVFEPHVRRHRRDCGRGGRFRGAVDVGRSVGVSTPSTLR